MPSSDRTALRAGVPIQRFTRHVQVVAGDELRHMQRVTCAYACFTDVTDHVPRPTSVALLHVRLATCV